MFDPWLPCDVGNQLFDLVTDLVEPRKPHVALRLHVLEEIDHRAKRAGRPDRNGCHCPPTTTTKQAGCIRLQPTLHAALASDDASDISEAPSQLTGGASPRSPAESKHLGRIAADHQLLLVRRQGRNEPGNDSVGVEANRANVRKV
jgi:hypothetical protein